MKARFMLILVLLANLLISCGFNATVSSDEEVVVLPSIQIKTYLQGFYNPGTELMRRNLNVAGVLPLNQPFVMTHGYTGSESVDADFFTINPDIIDWVLVELRRELDRTSVVATQAAFLDETGSIRDITGNRSLQFDIVEGEYYLVIKHMNHLSVMSATKQSISTLTSHNYDFSTDLSKVLSCENGFACQAELAPGLFGMFSGDVNNDGVVRYAGASNDTNSIRDFILAHPDNALGLNSFLVLSEYSQYDLNVDSNIAYTGAAPDAVNILQVVLSHPDNTGVSSLFRIEQNENI